MRNRLAQEFQDDDQPLMLRMRGSNQLPSAEDLLASNPTPHSGYCGKKSNSWLSYLLPCIFPKWKRRYFILCGNYLFRYANEHGERPKGVPIPLDACTVRGISTTAIEIATLRKNYVIEMSSENECKEWLKAIRSRKAEAIRENMGHAPMADHVVLANKAGKKLFNDRIQRDRLEGSQATLNPLAIFAPH